VEAEQSTDIQRLIKDLISIIKRRRKVLIWTSTIALVLYFVVLMLWTPTYQSNAIILIEEQDIPSDLVQTTVTSYAVQRIEEIKQRILTNSNIIDIVERFNLLDEKQLKRQTRSEIASHFRKNIAVSPISADVIDPRSGRPMQATIAFNVSFKGEQRGTVHKVTNEIVTLLLNENLKERTKQSESTSEFLQAEADALDKLLKELEQDISDFKEKHKGTLPELTGYNMSIVDRGHQEILSIQTRIQDLETRKLGLESQLTQLDKTAPKMLPNGETLLSPSDRLKLLRSEYAYKSSIYTDQHPELLRLKREIESLAKQPELLSKETLAEQIESLSKKLVIAREKYQPEHPNVKSLQRQLDDLIKKHKSTPSNVVELQPDNPTYIFVITQIDSINSEKSSLDSKMDELQKRIKLHEDYLLQTPLVEKEYQSLLRDYENSRLKYREIKGKLMTAELAKNLEQERKGERFTLIQPPEVPEKPVSPNMQFMSILGVLLGLALGSAAAYVAEILDGRVFGPHRIVRITGIEPLVTIPYFQPAKIKRKKNRYFIWMSIAFVLGILGLAAFHFFIKPLDVTWFILARKWGLQ
jgi:polysaccharide biosynthesis transport protein